MNIRTISTIGALGVLLLPGCNAPGTATLTRLAVSNPALYWNGRLYAEAGIDLLLNDVVSEALQSGVPLTITVEFRLTRRNRLFAREFDALSFDWMLEYLPLSERYTLQHAVTGTAISFPRLSILLNELRQRTGYPLGYHSRELGDGDFQVQVRARLNLMRLPAPLRLPALLSANWHLGDDWQTLPVPAAASDPAV